MDQILTARFLAYVAAFEKSYLDDDWTRLEEFFTPEAIYVVSGGAPLGGRWEGRTAVLDQLRDSVNGLDRRFVERKTEIVGAPTTEDDRIIFEWRGTYSLPGLPDLVFGGTETAIFEGDRIRFLEDDINQGDDAKIQAFLADHFDGLAS